MESTSKPRPDLNLDWRQSSDSHRNSAENPHAVDLPPASTASVMPSSRANDLANRLRRLVPGVDQQTGLLLEPPLRTPASSNVTVSDGPEGRITRLAKPLAIGWQGINLNCSRFCMEAAFLWIHGTKYGRDALGIPEYNRKTARVECRYGDARNAHTGKVKAHIDTPLKTAFSLDNYATPFTAKTSDTELTNPGYGLVECRKPSEIGGWEHFLEDYGPIIVGGRIGAVRALPAGAHSVVVTGINGRNVEYRDPLRPNHALGGKPSSMKFENFIERISDEVYILAAERKGESDQGGTGVNTVP
jgi:Papain-like cysteine protease AvrRpt2